MFDFNRETFRENKATFLWSSLQLPGNVFLSASSSSLHPHFSSRCTFCSTRNPQRATDALGLCVFGSEVCCRCLRVGLASTFPSHRPVSLLPQRDPVTGTNLFGVLEKTCRSGDDPTGQSVEEGGGGNDKCLEQWRQSAPTCRSSYSTTTCWSTRIIIDYIKTSSLKLVVP